jgi:ribosomal protein S20
MRRAMLCASSSASCAREIPSRPESNRHSKTAFRTIVRTVRTARLPTTSAHRVVRPVAMPAG